MLRILAGCVFSVLILAAIAVPEAAAQKTKVAVVKTWSGSVDDEKAAQPEVIISAKALETAWKAWKVAADLPKVDFTKEIVVAVYSGGSKLNIAGADLDEKGNLTVLGFGTRDIRPGFRYVLGTVNKAGVKTVNGKELPRD
jgi:hypothetical protein